MSIERLNQEAERRSRIVMRRRDRLNRIMDLMAGLLALLVFLLAVAIAVMVR